MLKNLQFGKRREKSDGNNPLLDPRLIDYSIGDRADRNAAGWRYGTFAALAAVVILAIALTVSATTRKDVVSVFREDQQGNYTYVGDASTNAPPSTQYGVEKALATWIACLRDIPNGDPVKVRQNGDCAFAFVRQTQNSQAYKFIYQQFSEFRPEQLNAEQHIHRDVDKVTVSPISPLSYSLAWTEYVYENGDLVNTLYQAATVTLATPPAPPTDRSIAEANPEGIELSTIDPHWSDKL